MLGIIVVSQTDLDPDGEDVEDLRKELGQEIHPISAAIGTGTKELSEYLRQEVKELRG